MLLLITYQLTILYNHLTLSRVLMNFVTWSRYGLLCWPFSNIHLPFGTLILGGWELSCGDKRGFRERERILPNTPIQVRRIPYCKEFRAIRSTFYLPLWLQWDKKVLVCNHEELTLLTKKPISQIKWDDVDGVCFMVGK